MLTTNKPNMGTNVASSIPEMPLVWCASVIKTSPIDLANVPASVGKNPALNVPLANDLGIDLDNKAMLEPTRKKECIVSQ